MFGQFQQSALRIEVAADATAITQSLTQAKDLKQWLLTPVLAEIPEQLQAGDRFTTQIGLIQVTHQVEYCNDHSLRLLLSESIDGFHEWSWGDGWLQSRLEGITVLPLNLSHTLNLWRLQQYLAQVSAQTGGTGE